jgi:hypothetical protein
MRIQSNEQPIPGFSWKDYEEFQEGNDADGEDDGWGVVQRKGSRVYSASYHFVSHLSSHPNQALIKQNNSLWHSSLKVA